MSDLGQIEEMALFFDTRSGGYDEHMQGMFHDFDRYYQAVASRIEPTERRVRILDLGCGTGNEIPYLLVRAPKAEITGIDMSPGMLDELKRKYGSIRGQLELICGSYLELSFAGEYDYAVSVYTMHHLQPEAKLRLYAKIRDALKPGGVYIEGDYVVGDQTARERLEQYAETLKQLPVGAQYHIDIPLSAGMQVDLLQEAGFEAPLIWQMEKEGAVFAARKSDCGGASGLEDRELCAWVSRHWELPFIEKTEEVGGSSDKVRRLQLSDGTRRYLKRLPGEDKVRLEALLHDALGAAGIRSAAPLPVRSGERGAQWKGNWYILTDELAGAVKDVVVPEDAAVYGRGLAKLHKGLCGLEGQFDYPLMDLPGDLQSWAIPKMLEHADADAEELKQLVRDMAHYGFPILQKLPVQMIHRDSHPGNIVLAEDGTVGFLDFDISVRGYRLFDLCYFATSQWGRNYVSGQEADSWLELVTALFEGYEEVSPLSGNERTAVFYILCAIQMIFTAYFQDNNRKDLAILNRSALMGLVRNRGRIEHFIG